MTATLSDTITRLRAAGCVFAEEEAALLADAAPDPRTLEAMVNRRVLGEPLEQVVGHADFCGVRVHLRPGVFVPRVRSELLVRLGAAAAEPGAVVVDLCCGSGALGLAVRHLRPEIELHAADLDPAAVACARQNFGTATPGNAPGEPDHNRHKSSNVHQGDLFDALPASLRGRISVLLANVPYVATRHIPLLPAEAKDHEPHLALDGGPDGLDVFRAVTSAAPAWLAPTGLLLSEITEAQAEAATAAMRASGLVSDIVYDEDLEARVIRGRLKMR